MDNETAAMEVFVEGPIHDDDVWRSSIFTNVTVVYDYHTFNNDTERRTVIVKTRSSSAACGQYLETGQFYLLFGKLDKKKKEFKINNNYHYEFGILDDVGDGENNTDYESFPVLETNLCANNRNLNDLSVDEQLILEKQKLTLEKQKQAVTHDDINDGELN